MKTKTNFILVIFMTIFQHGILAQVILGDEGIGISTNKYKNSYSIILERAEIKDPSLALRNYQQKKYTGGFADLLPVKTSTLSPGEFKSYLINNYQATRPIALIGYDDLSINWLLKNKRALIHSNTVIFIVNVETETQLKKLTKIISPLPWQLLNGNYFNTTLGIKYYPVLISKRGIEQ